MVTFSEFSHFLCVCLVWCLTSQSTAMVMLGRSVHLTTLLSWASLTKHVHILSLVTDNNPSRIRGREESDCRNYFIVNLHDSMWQGLDRTRTPGSAVRHITDCAKWPGLLWLNHEVVHFQCMTCDPRPKVRW